MGGPCLLVLIGLKVLVTMNSLQNIVISGTQDLLMLMGSKFLIKITRPQNTVFYLNVLRPSYFYQKFWSHQHQEALSTWNNNVLQWVHHDQIFKPIKTRSHWPPIWFPIFFSKACLVLGCPFFTPGVFLIRYICTCARNNIWPLAIFQTTTALGWLVHFGQPKLLIHFQWDSNQWPIHILSSKKANQFLMLISSVAYICTYNHIRCIVTYV